MTLSVMYQFECNGTGINVVKCLYVTLSVLYQCKCNGTGGNIVFNITMMFRTSNLWFLCWICEYFS